MEIFDCMSQFQHGLSNNRVKTFDLNTILSGMTQYNPYRVRLDIAYFAETENNKKIIFWIIVHTKNTVHLPVCTVHVS